MIVRHLANQCSSPTLMINEKSKKLIAAGRDIVRFGFGQSPFPVPDPLVASLCEHAHEKDYLEVSGLPDLRQAISEFYNEKENTVFSADNVIIGPGSKELIFLAQLCLDSRLILPRPSWVSYAPQANLLAKKAEWITTHASNDWMMSASDLARFCSGNKDAKRKLLILNYPNNPLGTSYTLQELSDIAEVCKEWELLVISDEIYGETHHYGSHASLARYYPEGTIISSGLSKWCGAGGWRLGHFCIPDKLKELRSAMHMAASETFTSVSAPIQYAAVKAYQKDVKISAYVKNIQQVLKIVSGYVFTNLNENILRTQAVGGFYLQIDFEPLRDRLEQNKIRTAESVCEHLLDKMGVALLPGTAFGFQNDRLCARLSYVDFNGEELLSNIDDFMSAGDQMQKYCPAIVKGVNQINKWVEEL